MDELQLLRRAREHVSEPEPSVLAEARARLERHARAATAPPRRLQRGGRFGLILAAGAAAAVAGIVATSVLTPGAWRGSVQSAAAAVLNEAADAIPTSDPVLGPGQYLLIETTTVESRTTDAAVLAAEVEQGRWVSFLASETHDRYVPADRSGEWVWLRHPPEVFQTFGAASAEAAARWEAELAAAPYPDDELLRAAGGRFYGAEPIPSASDLAELPRDPALLLERITELTRGGPYSPGGAALAFIAEQLRSGLVPADLRAAFYRAAAMIPGVTVTDDGATLDGRTGVAIGRRESFDGVRLEIIVDPQTGMFIGERHVLQERTDDWTYPLGTAVRWTAVRTLVVDSAPPGGTPNGNFDLRGCERVGPGDFNCPPTTGSGE